MHSLFIFLLYNKNSRSQFRRIYYTTRMLLNHTQSIFCAFSVRDTQPYTLRGKKHCNIGVPNMNNDSYFSFCSRTLKLNTIFYFRVARHFSFYPGSRLLIFI